VARGIVEWFSIDDGHGIIRRDNGDPIFLHFSAIPGEGYRTVPAGAQVEFEIVKGPQGRDCAFNLRVVQLGENYDEGSLTSKIVSGLNQ
jgi:CspA family cold shock protein